MDSLPVYDVGDVIELRAEFYDLDGQPASPTEVRLTVLRPGGARDEYAISPSSAGVYVVNYSTAGKPPGVYVFRFEGQGALEAAEEGKFQLRRPGL